MQSKICKRCNCSRPVEEFRFNHGYRENVCDICRREQYRKWTATNKDRVTENFNRWVTNNHERRLQHKKKWREKHKDSIAKVKADWYQRNRKAVLNKTKLQRKADPEKQKANSERLRRWQTQNPERYAKAKAARQERNREQQKAKSAAYRAANPEKVKEGKRRCYQARKEYYAEKNRAWLRSHKDDPNFQESSRARVRNRRARLAQAAGHHTAADIRHLYEVQNARCANPACGASLESGYHVDHIMPIKRGGSNDPSNLQLLCPTCNHKKSAKHPLDWQREVNKQSK